MCKVILITQNIENITSAKFQSQAQNKNENLFFLKPNRFFGLDHLVLLLHSSVHLQARTHISPKQGATGKHRYCFQSLLEEDQEYNPTRVLCLWESSKKLWKAWRGRILTKEQKKRNLKVNRSSEVCVGVWKKVGREKQRRDN